MGYTALEYMLEHSKAAGSFDPAVFEAQRRDPSQDRLLDGHALLVRVYPDFAPRRHAIACCIVCCCVQVELKHIGHA